MASERNPIYTPAIHGVIALGAGNVCLVRGNPTRSISCNDAHMDARVYGHTTTAMHDTSTPSSQYLLRLERDAWSMVKGLRQATKRVRRPARPPALIPVFAVT